MIEQIIDKFKAFFKGKKKKTYVAEMPDWISMAYWVLILSLFAYMIVRTTQNATMALPFLMLLPSLIGIFVLILLPVRALTALITEIILRIQLFHVPKNNIAETVIVIGKSEYFQPSFWYSPNYGAELLLLVKYLQILGTPFSIYYNTSIEILDSIMANKNVKTVYIYGHGRRHGFAIDAKTVVDYCRYDDPRFRKEYVFQIHCNQGGGKSLVEYVVPKENQTTCLPEHGFMTNLTINQMFIDKIIAFKQYSGIREGIMRVWYSFIANAIPFIIFIVWGFILSKMVA